MIEKAIDPKDILPLLKLSGDNLEELNCNRDEWVQFLVASVSNDRWAIWISRNKNDEIDAYAVMVKNVDPPLLNSIVVVYVWSINHNALLQIFDLADVWARASGIKKFTGKTNVPDAYFESLGYKMTAKYVEREIG